jgi:hypothetical protein
LFLCGSPHPSRRILDRFLEAPPAFRPELRPAPSREELLENIKRVAELFTAFGFDVRSSVSASADGRTVRVVSEAPANLWALSWLMFRKDKLLNDYQAKAVASLLTRSGITGFTYKTEVQAPNVVSTFSLPS